MAPAGASVSAGCRLVGRAQPLSSSTAETTSTIRQVAMESPITLSCSKKYLRSFATLGATTTWQ